ncbi:hypothetical protein CJD36_009715 [Flavipsychrobacter stenotrophus]|uniref:Uncharacterized protein n=1 Tax=Flavipsychrobacter stenotrophus TaxID=2077091 RepID=A0A2S7SZQ4_9BACT|nr:hypothetical protein [Flavipsychrobacter stenotrophus]PQJ12055.1 hypothetical protein CJD36_009715 [Flavipsychrobacter stenotrophus]
MRGRALFIISFIVIILFSWANVDYFGSVHNNAFGPTVNQIVHIIAFLLTAGIGYINWRQHDKWVNSLWLGLYALVLLLFLASGVLFHFTHNELIKRTGAGLRNRFTEPLPFLVFYLFTVLSKQLSRTTDTHNKKG